MWNCHNVGSGLDGKLQYVVFKLSEYPWPNTDGLVDFISEPQTMEKGGPWDVEILDNGNLCILYNKYDPSEGGSNLRYVLVNPNTLSTVSGPGFFGCTAFDDQDDNPPNGIYEITEIRALSAEKFADENISIAYSSSYRGYIHCAIKLR